MNSTPKAALYCRLSTKSKVMARVLIVMTLL